MTNTEIKEVYGLEILEGIDLENRIIYFNSLSDEEANMGTITYSTTERIIRAINLMAKQNSTPITLNVSCYGGDIYSVFALVDAIRSCVCPIVFKGTGIIASGGTILCCVCDERYLTPNSVFMIHAGSNYGTPNNHIDAQIESNQSEAVRQTLYKIYEDSTHLSKGKVEELCSRDAYLTPEEALALGFIDGIIPIIRTKSPSREPDEKEIYKVLKDISRRTLKKTSKSVLKKRRRPITSPS